MQNKQIFKNRDLFIGLEGVGVWELNYQARQSEKMLRSCEVVHLGVIGSDAVGISHIHQELLPPIVSTAVSVELLGCRGILGWVGVWNATPQLLATTLALSFPLLTSFSVVPGPCSGNVNQSGQKSQSCLLSHLYWHTLLVWFPCLSGISLFFIDLDFLCMYTKKILKWGTKMCSSILKCFLVV